eukprot:352737-Chlamydomonas_euryale.AAC.5
MHPGQQQLKQRCTGMASYLALDIAGSEFGCALWALWRLWCPPCCCCCCSAAAADDDDEELQLQLRSAGAATAAEYSRPPTGLLKTVVQLQDKAAGLGQACNRPCPCLQLATKQHRRAAAPAFVVRIPATIVRRSAPG